MRNVYERGVVIEIPPDQRRAADLPCGDPKKVVTDPTEARSTAKTIRSPGEVLPQLTRTTERGNYILLTAAAWSPEHECSGDLSSLDAIVVALTEHADKRLERTHWLAAPAFSLDLPYNKYRTEDLPESAFYWDMKAHSRQHFFTTIGVPLDPGHIVWSCIL